MPSLDFSRSRVKKKTKHFQLQVGFLWHFWYFPYHFISFLIDYLVSTNLYREKLNFMGASRAYASSPRGPSIVRTSPQSGNSEAWHLALPRGAQILLRASSSRDAPSYSVSMRTFMVYTSKSPVDTHCLNTDSTDILTWGKTVPNLWRFHNEMEVYKFSEIYVKIGMQPSARIQQEHALPTQIWSDCVQNCPVDVVQ